MEREEAVITVNPISDAYRVLLVDDHALVRELLRSILEGYRELAIIGEAVNGQEAISMAATLKPDVIVMDVNMPRLNGHEATKRIRRAQPETIVIGISINDSPQMRQLMKDAGADAFLSKEAATEELYPMITQLMQTRVMFHKTPQPMMAIDGIGGCP